MHWFLYDTDLRHERVNVFRTITVGHLRPTKTFVFLVISFSKELKHLQFQWSVLQCRKKGQGTEATTGGVL